jgi:hypothetical protein
MLTATAHRKPSSSSSIPHMILRFPTLHLAFELTQLEQVISLPSIAYGQTDIIGLAALPGDRAPGQIIVIDLHRRLYGGSLADPAYLLLFRASDGLIYGLPVADFPEIQAIPADCFDNQPMPMDSAPGGIGLTRQVIKRPTPMGEQMLFMIDGDSLAQEIRQIMTEAPDRAAK